MGFEKTLHEHFRGALPEEVFVEKTVNALSVSGFTPENTIACVGVCRDEIAQLLVEKIGRTWGTAFNLSGLAGMLFAGRTGFTAAEHHSPNEDGRERYLFIAMPHLAIGGDGTIGACVRRGRLTPSSACGALIAFQKELAAGNVPPGLDVDDVELSLIRTRLLKEVRNKPAPDLLEVTRTVLAVVEHDLERMIRLTVDTARSDYACITGIQIHGPEGNYVWPSLAYALSEGIRNDVSLA